MNQSKIAELEAFAKQIRIETLRELAAAGSGHIGGALDLADVLAVLYQDMMNVDPSHPDDPARDYFVLSKGHAGPVLYATLALMGYFPIEQLATLNKPGTKLPSHCDCRKTKGVDMTAGSLGQGIGAAVGIALGNKKAGRNNYTYCIIGDGEMDEGSVWEAMLLAPQFQLDHLIVIVDNNGLQIDGATKDIVNLGDISEKARSFGWYTLDVDGHDVEAIHHTLSIARKAGKPAFINLHTVKAKGWPKYENQLGSHHVKSISHEEAEAVIAALQTACTTVHCEKGR